MPKEKARLVRDGFPISDMLREQDQIVHVMLEPLPMASNTLTPAEALVIHRVKREAALCEEIRHRLVTVEVLTVPVRQKDVGLWGPMLRRPGAVVQPESAGIFEEHVEEAGLGGGWGAVLFCRGAVLADESVLQESLESFSQSQVRIMATVEEFSHMVEVEFGAQHELDQAPNDNAEDVFMGPLWKASQDPLI